MGKLLGRFLRILAWLAPFNQYQQQILDETSSLYQLNPDLILLHVELDTLLPEIFLTNFLQLSPEAIKSQKNEIINLFKTLITNFEKHSKGLFLLSNFIVPSFSQIGILDSKQNGIRRFYQELNNELQTACGESNQTYIFDLDNAAAIFGKATTKIGSNIIVVVLFFRIISYQHYLKQF